MTGRSSAPHHAADTEGRVYLPAEHKKPLRKEGIAARDALGPEVRADWSARICANIARLPAFETARTVLIYRSVRGEVQLARLDEEARRRGKTVAYPFCRPDGFMDALVPEDQTAFRRGAFGIEEPDPARSRRLDPGEVDFIVCPCTRFDGEGGRLGMGGGYYDRFLKRTKGFAVIAGFSVQQAESFPHRPRDVRIPVTVTEKEIIMSQQTKWSEQSAAAFARAVASKTSVPGGGGASSLAGALAAALGSMVGVYTMGKPRYADVEEDIQALTRQADTLREEFLECIEADAAAFEPLSRAYSIPKDDPDRDAVLERCLLDAAAVPMRIAKLAVETAGVLHEFGRKGSKLMISDAATGAAIVEGVLKGAVINVRVNTRLMKDREAAAALDAEAEALLEAGRAEASLAYAEVFEKLAN